LSKYAPSDKHTMKHARVVYKILVVEDDNAMRDACVMFFREAGYACTAAASGEEALGLLQDGREYDIVIADIKMPGMDGIELLRRVKECDPTIEVLLMTGYGSIRSAVEAMKLGAADYVTKPFDRQRLLDMIAAILQDDALGRGVFRFRSSSHGAFQFDNIIGGSRAMRRVYDSIEAASRSRSTVLICGESGTGKELVAKAIHYNGPRSNAPFVPVNCSAIPHELIESELFGHTKGSFTGASSDAVGLFRAADGGTLFLDEVGDMPLSTQAKLLRVVQDGMVRAVGNTAEIAVDVRIIAATNRDIAEAVRLGQFREDLFYRLSVITITIPPLRDRREDIPALIYHFIDKLNRSSHRKITGVERKALAAMMGYSWPGNVREMESLLENVFVFGRSNTIRIADLPQAVAACADYNGDTSADVRLPSLREAERNLIERALKLANGNKAKAARMLGISRPRLYNKMRAYQISL